MNKKYLFFIVLPLVLITVAVFLNQARGPYWLGSNLDPEYVYLLNSANLAGLRGVGHIDHPGTPVQVLGAVSIRLIHFFSFSSNVDWHTDVLQRPEFYLKSINAIMVGLNAVMLSILGMVMFWVTHQLWMSIWLQLAPFFSITLLEFGLTRVSPEPLLFFCSMALTAIVILFLKMALSRDNSRESNKNQLWLILLLFSLIVGLGIATKITFIPMIVVPFLIIPKFKNKIYFLLGVGVGFIIFTLPIIRMYPKFFSWIEKLFSHSGQYGSGPSQLLSTQNYLKNLKSLLTGNPLFSTSLVLGIIIIAVILLNSKWKKNSQSKIYFKVLIAVLAAQLLGLIMVSKHSANHYLLPLLSITAFTFVLIYLNLKHSFDLFKISSKIVAFLSMVILLMLAIYVNPPSQIEKKIRQLTNLKKKSMRLYYEVQNLYKDYGKIYYYRCSSPEYALKFGNDLARSYHSEKLQNLYKDTYFYDIWSKRFMGFDYNKGISFDKIQAKYGDKIVFQGSKGVKIPGLHLKKISEISFYEGIFILSPEIGGSF